MSGWHAPDELLPLGETDYVAQMRETLRRGRPDVVHVSETPTGIEDPGSYRTYYEFQSEFPNWEPDPDSPYMYREDWYPHRNPYMPYRPRTLRPEHSRERAKKFEQWTEGGRPVGRWSWIYRDTP